MWRVIREILWHGKSKLLLCRVLLHYSKAKQQPYGSMRVCNVNVLAWCRERPGRKHVRPHLLLWPSGWSRLAHKNWIICQHLKTEFTSKAKTPAFHWEKSEVLVTLGPHSFLVETHQQLPLLDSMWPQNGHHPPLLGVSLIYNPCSALADSAVCTLG